jgi:uncharacterized protein
LIIVFARAPVLGQVKTRLAPQLGAWRATCLHERLTRHAVATALAARCGRVELHGTRQHRFFKTLGVRFRAQKGKDLGERMHHALSGARRPAILIGSDCPALTAADLRRAMRWLRGGCDAVVAPTQDGGYALIALRHSRKEFFNGIDWGGPHVYAETARKLAGYRWRALRTLWDVDRPEDLERLRSLRWTSASRRGARR